MENRIDKNYEKWSLQLVVIILMNLMTMVIIIVDAKIN